MPVTTTMFTLFVEHPDLKLRFHFWLGGFSMHPNIPQKSEKHIQTKQKEHPLPLTYRISRGNLYFMSKFIRSNRTCLACLAQVEGWKYFTYKRWWIIIIEKLLHPGKLTWNPKNGGCKKHVPFQCPVIFRFQPLIFRGVYAHVWNWDPTTH